MMYKIILLMLLLFGCISAQAQFSFDRNKLQAIRWSPLPEKVVGIKDVKLDLNGTWKFHPSPNENLWKQDQLKNWHEIEVPGEWVMQGYEVVPGVAAGYKRNFILPAEWKGRRVKLRCEAVYSECEIWINGQNAGGHIGGFTPFELDITDKVKNGTNTISLAVKNESLSDSLSSGSKYAVHQLGGISRPIYLLALPEVNVASFHVSTTFDRNYEDASLYAEFSIANEVKESKSAELRLTLKDSKGTTVTSEGVDRMTVELAPGMKTNLSATLNVKHPEKWDPEHPNLYYLQCSVFVEGEEMERVVRPFGFRQIEVRGNQVFVNNRPVKLRGVCRHEVHPLRGRSLTGDIWYKDVKLFKEGNVNYIRTAHYPPNEKLLEACDELGMFVEVEGPFCWADSTHVSSINFFDGIIRPVAEMMERDRSHPCILHWSVANESRNFNKWFKTAADLMKDIDPTRPRIFSQWGAKADNGYLELDNHHYPGPDGPAMYKEHKRPITFDEYCHLNAYNRYELMTDPGVRDYWGDILFGMWEKMQEAKGVLGGALWAGIDDSFFLPSGYAVGYGTWGPVDGWRRKKPEFWHMKKTYSPVKVALIKGKKGESVKLALENRYLFSNLKECKIKWRNGNQKGCLSPDIEPGEKGVVTLPFNNEIIERLTIDVFNYSEVPVDQYAFDHTRPEITVAKDEDEKFRWSIKGKKRIAKSSSITVEVSSEHLQVVDANGNYLINDWPELMLVPFNGKGGVKMTEEVKNYEIFSPAASNRCIERINVEEREGLARIEINESYDEAAGVMTIDITPAGGISVSYDYQMMKNDCYRQWGVCFPLAKDFNTLTWKRKGLWSVYPQDHIGRLEGEAKLFYNDERCGLAGPAKEPGWNYNMDQTRYGSNDFRSTKRNVFDAELSSSTNRIHLISDGTQHVRCWYDDQQVHMFVAEYDNPGSERFIRDFTTHARMFDLNLIRGQRLKGMIKMRRLK